MRCFATLLSAVLILSGAPASAQSALTAAENEAKLELVRPIELADPNCLRSRQLLERATTEMSCSFADNRSPACNSVLNDWYRTTEVCNSVLERAHANAEATILAPRAYAQAGSYQASAGGQCISSSRVQERDSFGNPSCGIRVENECGTPVECQLEMTGVDSQGRRHPSRQAIHLQAGDSGARTINNVLACESLRVSCKPRNN